MNDGPPEELQEISPRIGLLGELEVEMQLANAGWHPVRLDTAQMASNADLIAVNERRRVSIQVKTTASEKQKSYSQWLQFGYSTGYLKEGKSFFNSKRSPLIADIIVAVSYRPNASRFIVLPVAFAEALCQCHASYWYQVPAKKKMTGKMGKRSHTFPIYLCLNATRESHGTHHDRMKRNILKYENAWKILRELIEKLHDWKEWPLLR